MSVWGRMTGQRGREEEVTRDPRTVRRRQNRVESCVIRGLCTWYICLVLFLLTHSRTDCTYNPRLGSTGSGV